MKWRSLPRNPIRSLHYLMKELVEVDGERKDLRDWIQLETEPRSLMVVADKIQIHGELTRSEIFAVQNAKKSLKQGPFFAQVNDN